MRTIKFRAWDKENKRMYDGLPNFGSKVWWFPDEGYGVSLKELELMQFTGLLDKNGKEIYEGDVVCVFDEAVVPITDEGQGPIEACNHLVAVEMRNGVWGFEIPKSDDGETGWYGLHYWNEEISSDGYEVIGNIYEHPDLIK